MMEKRGAIGLSINILVIIIISLVILGSGVTLLYKFISGAEEIKGELDVRTDQELERLLVDQGQRVALPLHAATVLRGETHVFGLGILNIGPKEDFQIFVSLSDAFNEQNEVITNVDEDEWIFYDESKFTLEQNENQKEPILVSVPKDAVPGSYVFVATVSTTEIYGNPQTFFVTVE